MKILPHMNKQQMQQENTKMLWKSENTKPESRKGFFYNLEILEIKNAYYKSISCISFGQLNYVAL